MLLKYFLLDKAAENPNRNQKKSLVLPRVACLQNSSVGRTRRLPEQVFLATLSSLSKETSSYTLIHTSIWRPGRPSNTACTRKPDMCKERERTCKAVVVASYSEATER